MKQFLFFFTFLFSIPFANAQHSAQVLADVLAEKGMLSSTERQRIKEAIPTEAVEMIAALLRDKGLLNHTEMARISPMLNPTGTPGNNAPVVANALTPAPAPAPVVNAATVSGEPKVTTGSAVKVSLYGTLLLNSFYDTALFNNQDVPLYANKQGSDTTGSDKSYGMTVRQSRFGLRLQGPTLWGAQTSGQVEIDMFAGNATLPVSVGFDVPRLRLGFMRADWKNVSLVAGQDFSVFAPLSPTSLAGFSAPDMTASGNLWIRSPQLRAEFRRNITEKRKLQWQVALTDPNVGDYPSTFSTVRTPGVGERGRGPGYESRLSYTDSGMTLGLSGHYNRGKNAGTGALANVQTGVDSWGVAADYLLPLGKRANLSGEAYQGRALGLFGSAQGQAVTAVGTPGQHGVKSRGGWVQLQVNWGNRWQNNLAWGIDSLNTRQVVEGNRNKTQTYMGNLIYKWSPNTSLAWEWRRFLTNFQNQNSANEQGDHVNMAIAFTF
jgi:hypothetical protein